MGCCAGKSSVGPAAQSAVKSSRQPTKPQQDQKDTEGEGQDIQESGPVKEGHPQTAPWKSDSPGSEETSNSVLSARGVKLHHGYERVARVYRSDPAYLRAVIDHPRFMMEERKKAHRQGNHGHQTREADYCRKDRYGSTMNSPSSQPSVKNGSRLQSQTASVGNDIDETNSSVYKVGVSGARKNGQGHDKSAYELKLEELRRRYKPRPSARIVGPGEFG